MIDPFIKDFFTHLGDFPKYFVMAVWGGTSCYLSKMSRGIVEGSVSGYFAKIIISAFFGLTGAFACLSMGFDVYMTAAVSGIAGHHGSIIVAWAIKNYMRRNSA